MKILLILLVVIIIIMVSGGFWFYVNIFKKMAKEFKEFVEVTFEALKDRKLTVAEKERIMKEWADIQPLTKKLKDGFIEDVKELGDDVKEVYNKLKSVAKSESKPKAKPKAKAKRK